MRCSVQHSFLSLEYLTPRNFYSLRNIPTIPNIKDFNKTQVPFKGILCVQTFAMPIQILHFIVYYDHKFNVKKEH